MDILAAGLILGVLAALFVVAVILSMPVEVARWAYRRWKDKRMAKKESVSCAVLFNHRPYCRRRGCKRATDLLWGHLNDEQRVSLVREKRIDVPATLFRGYGGGWETKRILRIYCDNSPGRNGVIYCTILDELGVAYKTLHVNETVLSEPEPWGDLVLARKLAWEANPNRFIEIGTTCGIQY